MNYINIFLQPLNIHLYSTIDSIQYLPNSLSAASHLLKSILHFDAGEFFRYYVYLFLRIVSMPRNNKISNSVFDACSYNLKLFT